MAISIESDIVSISDAESTTSWGGDSFSLDNEILVEGSNSVSCSLTTNGANSVYYDLASATDFSSSTVRLYFNTTIVPNLGTVAQNGIQAFFFDGTNTTTQTVGGNDTYQGGWVDIILDPRDTAKWTSSVVSSATRVGLNFNTQSKPRNVPANTWLDSWRAVDDVYFSQTTNSEQMDFSDMAAADGDQYNVLNEKDGVVSARGTINLGPDIGTANYLDVVSNNETVIFVQNSSTNDIGQNLYALKSSRDSAASPTRTSSISLTNFVLLSPSTNKAEVDFSTLPPDSLTIDSCVFNSLSDVALGGSSSITITDSSINFTNSCSFESAGSLSLTGVTLLESTGTTLSFLGTTSCSLTGCSFTNVASTSVSFTSNATVSSTVITDTDSALSNSSSTTLTVQSNSVFDMATLSLSGNLITQSGASITADGGTSSVTGNLTMSSATLNYGTDSLSIGGTLNADQSTMSGGTTTLSASTATHILSGGSGSYTFTSLTTNASTGSKFDIDDCTISSSITSDGSGTTANNATFNNCTSISTPAATYADCDFTGTNSLSDTTGGSTLTNCTFASGTINILDPTVSNTTFTGTGTLTLNGEGNIGSCTFSGCGEIDTATSTPNSSARTGDDHFYESCTFTNATGTSAVLVKDLTCIDACDFTSSGTGHAVRVSSTSATGTFVWNSTTSGYASTDGSTGNEVIYLEPTSGTYNIQLQNNAPKPSVRSAGATFNILGNQVTFTVTVRDIETNALIGDARVYIEAAQTTQDYTSGDLVLNATTATSGGGEGTADAVVSLFEALPVTGRVRLASNGTYYKTAPFSATISNTQNSQLTVFLIPDD